MVSHGGAGFDQVGTPGTPAERRAVNMGEAEVKGI
jgi:hypothetical protein